MNEHQDPHEWEVEDHSCAEEVVARVCMDLADIRTNTGLELFSTTEWRALLHPVAA